MSNPTLYKSSRRSALLSENRFNSRQFRTRMRANSRSHGAHRNRWSKPVSRFFARFATGILRPLQTRSNVFLGGSRSRSISGCRRTSQCLPIPCMQSDLCVGSRISTRRPRCMTSYCSAGSNQATAPFEISGRSKCVEPFSKRPVIVVSSPRKGKKCPCTLPGTVISACFSGVCTAFSLLRRPMKLARKT